MTQRVNSLLPGESAKSNAKALMTNDFIRYHKCFLLKLLYKRGRVYICLAVRLRMNFGQAGPDQMTQCNDRTKELRQRSKEPRDGIRKINDIQRRYRAENRREPDNTKHTRTQK